MFNANGTYYSEDHSISFGYLVESNADSHAYTDFYTMANTWATWHLIPFSRPSIEHPTVITKYIEIPGANSMLDMSTYLTGNIQFGQRTGNLQFYIDNNHEHHEAIREKMMDFFHGKIRNMRLMDDPTYYYTGRFTVGKLEPGANYSSISIGYQLEPYKLKINTEGSTCQVWDTFNFDKDYDYSVVFPIYMGAGYKEVTINSINDYSFAIELRSNSMNDDTYASFRGGNFVLLPHGAYRTIGYTVRGENKIAVRGNAKSVDVRWRGGSL